MKKFTLTFCFIVCACLASAQIRWEPGYFIDNAGQRTEGLIQNRDWNDNPTSFQYKVSADSPEIKRTIEDVQEFSIAGQSKYIRATVDMERASNKLGDYQTDKQPVFKSETLFLKVLVQGENTLYHYTESGLSKFFFSNNDTGITQLIYIKYRRYIDYIQGYEEGTFENNQYKNQLWNHVKCDDTELKSIERLKYDRQDLVNYFLKVNGCYATQAEADFVAPRPKGDFNLRLEAGYSMYKHSVTRNIARFSSEISDSGANFGMEAEYILPTNKQKWAVIVGVNINNFEGEQEIPSNSINGESITATHNFIQVPAGMRHYMYLNKTSKFFATGALVINIVHEGKLDYRSSTDFEADPYVYNFYFGLGYEYGRFSAEARIFTPSGIVNNLESKFHKSGIAVRYKIF
ncbi:MAG: outer membrane beta-barrel protein [Flavobacterium sp.]|nr:outer membrane beta-barrel protein [Flavobacterium sp.]